MMKAAQSRFTSVSLPVFQVLPPLLLLLTLLFFPQCSPLYLGPGAAGEISDDNNTRTQYISIEPVFTFHKVRPGRSVEFLLTITNHHPNAQELHVEVLNSDDLESDHVAIEFNNSEFLLPPNSRRVLSVNVSRGDKLWHKDFHEISIRISNEDGSVYGEITIVAWIYGAYFSPSLLEKPYYQACCGGFIGFMIICVLIGHYIQKSDYHESQQFVRIVKDLVEKLPPDLKTDGKPDSQCSVGTTILEVNNEDYGEFRNLITSKMKDNALEMMRSIKKDSQYKKLQSVEFSNDFTCRDREYVLTIDRFLKESLKVAPKDIFNEKEIELYERMVKWAENQPDEYSRLMDGIEFLETEIEIGRTIDFLKQSPSYFQKVRTCIKLIDDSFQSLPLKEKEHLRKSYDGKILRLFIGSFDYYDDGLSKDGFYHTFLKDNIEYLRTPKMKKIARLPRAMFLPSPEYGLKKKPRKESVAEPKKKQIEKDE